MISIHAPTRGATHPVCRSYRRYHYFNPRSHERSDIISKFNHHGFVISIHAPTRGATITQSKFISCKLISIHAPTRGATNSRFELIVSTALNFNPRSHERSDFHLYPLLLDKIDFNPRSHERSDSNIAQKICLFLYNTDNKYIIR